MHLGNGRVWGEGLSRRKKATRYPAALKGNAGQVRATEGERGLEAEAKGRKVKWVVSGQ